MSSSAPAVFDGRQLIPELGLGCIEVVSSIRVRARLRRIQKTSPWWGPHLFLGDCDGSADGGLGFGRLTHFPVDVTEGRQAERDVGVVRAEHFFPDGERALFELEGLVEAILVAAHDRQGVEAGGEVPVVGPVVGLFDLGRTPPQPFCFRQIAGEVPQRTEVVQALADVGVVRRQDAFAQGEGPPVDHLGLVEPALVPQDVAEGVEAETEVGVLAEPPFADLDRSTGRSFGFLVAPLQIDQCRLVEEGARQGEFVFVGECGADRHRPIEQGLGAVELAEDAEHPTHGLHEGGLGLRLIVELLDPVGAAVEDLAGGEIFTLGQGRVGTVEEPDQKLRDLAGGGCLAVGAFGLAADSLGLHRHGDGEDDQHDERHGRAADQGAVAAGELAHLVDGARRPRQDRLRLEVALDVLGQGRG